MSRIVGIDLGTTNSLVAYMDGQTPRVIRGRNERAMVPSVVAVMDNGLIVGDPAKEFLVRYSSMSSRRAVRGNPLPAGGHRGIPHVRSRPGLGQERGALEENPG